MSQALPKFGKAGALHQVSICQVCASCIPQDVNISKTCLGKPNIDFVAPGCFVLLSALPHSGMGRGSGAPCLDMPGFVLGLFGPATTLSLALTDKDRGEKRQENLLVHSADIS